MDESKVELRVQFRTVREAAILLLMGLDHWHFSDAGLMPLRTCTSLFSQADQEIMAEKIKAGLPRWSNVNIDTKVAPM